ncbi:MAG: glycosyltransferase family 2 protein [Nitrospirae bacterium]|nr:glycosyltransferase family 2 protein [Nitrospirota bacterium]
MKVSLVIPTLNEAGCIEKTLSEIPKNTVNEVIVVDGHSTDGTADIVRNLGYRVILQKSMGYGGAFTEGISEATGDIVILMDADGSHNPTDIPVLIEKIKEGYDYVLAVRYAPGYRSDDDTLIRHIGNMLFTFLVNLIHKAFISDALYLYTAIRKDKFPLIEPKSQGFEYCVEILIRAHKAGLKIAQVPSAERLRGAGKSKVNALTDGLKILKTILFVK